MQNWTYDIKNKYLENLEILKLSFPEAYEFLKHIEGLGHKNFHMGTAVNMHFYYEDHFLFYFVFHTNPRNTSNAVKFSSEYNLRLKHDASVSSPE
ncbi:MAG: hypothetical protein LH629_13715, partial [Ignavibacteria bacterium]|nr:hypothetical protein [Ignavibacteria bacterium]